MSVQISEIDVATLQANIETLADILRANVLKGASVGYVLPFSQEEAEAFWSDLTPSMAPGQRRILVAHWNQKLVGTVQLVQETRPNGVHRAEISKLLVHPENHGKGIGRALMLAAETLAIRQKRTLLVLDTAGNIAETLYLSLGYVVAGTIPQFAVAPDRSKIEATKYMYKLLA